MHYQWILTLCPLPNALLEDKMLLSFSVPASLLPMPHEPAVHDANRDTKMGTQVQQVLKLHALAVCNVDGCSEKGKYRLVHQKGKGGNSIMLHGYPGHSPKWCVRLMPLPTPFINVHPNLKQPCTPYVSRSQRTFSQVWRETC